MHCLQCTVHNALITCTVYKTLRCTVYNALFAMCCLQCTVYNTLKHIHNALFRQNVKHKKQLEQQNTKNGNNHTTSLNTLQASQGSEQKALTIVRWQNTLVTVI